MIHFSISYDDYQNWPETHTLSTWELQQRARGAEKRNEAVWYLDKAQFAKWRAGLATPWLVPNHYEVVAQNPLRSWPVLPEQIKP